MSVIHVVGTADTKGEELAYLRDAIAAAGGRAIIVDLGMRDPSISVDNVIDFASTDTLVKQATDKGFKVLMPILGWVGLGEGRGEPAGAGLGAGSP